MNDKKLHSDKQVFTIPQGYFESFEDRLNTEIRFRELFPEKKECFAVPKEYFDQVEEIILTKNRKPEGKLISMNTRSLMAVISAVAAILIVSLLILKPASTVIGFESLTISSLEDYFEEEDRMHDFFTAEELAEIENRTSIFSEYSVSDEVLLEYLDDYTVREGIINE